MKENNFVFLTAVSVAEASMFSWCFLVNGMDKVSVQQYRQEVVP